MQNVIDYAPLLLSGFGVTIALALLSLALATFCGILGAAAKLSGGRWLQAAMLGYTTIVRGVPELVLIMLIYFGGERLLQRTVKPLLGLEEIELSRFAAGVFAIGIIYGAYLTETFRGAYMMIPRGQSEAARALGLKPRAILIKVLGPQLLRFALPGYANVWQVLVKATAVVSVIGLQDLVGRADDIGKSVRDSFTFMFVALIGYLLITSVSSRVFAWAAKRSAAWA